MWSIWHFPVLGILVLPLVLWAYSASRPPPKMDTTTASSLPPDTSTGAFLLRLAAVVIGFVALFSLTSDGKFGVAIGQTLFALALVAVLFLLAWSIPRLFGRRMQSPRKKAFELLLFVFALFVVFVLLQLKMEQIAR